MFDPSERPPRVFGLAPGCDFPALLVQGLDERLTGRPHEDLARTTLYVNTRRMQRRIYELYDAGPARLLPRVKLISDIGRDTALQGLPMPVSPLRRRLELASLVKGLIEADPTLAPKSAVFDLADSLAALIDEVQGEGVPVSALETLVPGDVSAHWDRNARFLALTSQYLGAAGEDHPDPEARQRMAVERLVAAWQSDPPPDPVLVAGSTGSRGTTLLLMEAVAQLPQGAVILPGLDTDLPPDVWSTLSHGKMEDHPQFRFIRYLDELGMSPEEVRPWLNMPPPAPARNRLVSLALRPAPVTDAWRREGPRLGDLMAATEGLTLVEATDPRAEARTIAWLLREAIETGQRAALVTSDRMLTRRVSALLDRWSIVPDDSAGRPFALSPPGRLLRQTARIVAERVTLDGLLALLKHPLVHSGEARGDHLLKTRDLELWLRRRAVPWVDAKVISKWVEDDPTREPWAAWVQGALDKAKLTGARHLAELVDHHLTLTTHLVAGYASEDISALWDKPAGRKAAEIMADLTREAKHGAPILPIEYVSLFQDISSKSEVREPETPHPDVMIWGTMEARVQGADLIILGGLNDGAWPDLPAPDPWLNRQMRASAGLLMPERRIGLAAHDFQQAIAAPKAVLTRSLKDDAAEPVPSRWLNRLTNLLTGLEEREKPSALGAMRERGQQAMKRAAQLDRPVAPVAQSARPSPRPPVEVRPRALSFTGVETLIRDPYAVYARYVLGLRPLRPLRPEPDPLLKGTVLHEIFAAFMQAWRDDPVIAPSASLMALAQERILRSVEWPLEARLLLGRIARISEQFIEEETLNRDISAFLAAEVEGRFQLHDQNFTLHGRADRIDLKKDGSLVLLDYKSSKGPSKPNMERFAVQLLLEALVAEAGGFEEIDTARVDHVRYVPLNGEPRSAPCALDDGKQFFSPASIRAGFERLVAAYDQRELGYTSRRNLDREGDYDHLARFGEWDEADPPVPEQVG